MQALDFEFDNLRLQDFGMTLANFDGGGMDTIDSAEITHNTITSQHGITHHITSVEYDYLTFTLQICKNLCEDNDEVISLEQARDIYRWLNRKEFHKFKPIDINGEYTGIYFMCTFNISNIEIDGRLVGFELEAITNSPFARYEPVTLNFSAEAGEIKNIYVKNDDESHIYPDVMEITIKEAGDLEIYNEFEDRTMLISNCSAGEIITIEYPMISSSLTSHKIQNDFNWRFFRLASTFKNRLNKVEFSLACSIKLVYTPVVKVGV